MDKPILYKGHEWRGRSGTGYVCDECGAICEKAEEMTLTECRPRLAPELAPCRTITGERYAQIPGV